MRHLSVINTAKKENIEVCCGSCGKIMPYTSVATIEQRESLGAILVPGGPDLCQLCGNILYPHPHLKNQKL